MGQSYGERELAVNHLSFVNRIGCNLAALYLNLVAFIFRTVP